MYKNATKLIGCKKIRINITSNTLQLKILTKTTIQENEQRNSTLFKTDNTMAHPLETGGGEGRVA